MPRFPIIWKRRTEGKNNAHKQKEQMKGHKKERKQHRKERGNNWRKNAWENERKKNTWSNANKVYSSKILSLRTYEPDKGTWIKRSFKHCKLRFLLRLSQIYIWSLSLLARLFWDFPLKSIQYTSIVYIGVEAIYSLSTCPSVWYPLSSHSAGWLRPINYDKFPEWILIPFRNQTEIKQNGAWWENHLSLVDFPSSNVENYQVVIPKRSRAMWVKQCHKPSPSHHHT